MQKLKTAYYLLGKEKHFKYGSLTAMKNLRSLQKENQIFTDLALNGKQLNN